MRRRLTWLVPLCAGIAVTISWCADHVWATPPNGFAATTTLDVDASAAPGGGTYARITDAVAAAQSGDMILVAPGVYSQEDVPILVAKDGITIHGATVLTRDAGDIATGVVRSTAAIVSGGRSSAGPWPAALMYVTGQDVTIRGLVIDGQHGANFGIFVDGLAEPDGARFIVADNAFGSCGLACLFTRGASGTIEGNLFGDVSKARVSLHDFVAFGGHFGAIVAGGRANFDPVSGALIPWTEVTINRNRVTQTSFAGIYCIGDRATVPAPNENPGSHGPGALRVQILDNIFDRNGNLGLSLVPHGNHFNFSEGDQHALIVAHVEDNTFDENYHYGFGVVAPIGSFLPEVCANAEPGEVRATLGVNAWHGNDANDAVFAFASYNLVVHDRDGCYVHDNRIEVDGVVPPFDYDAPLCVLEPASGECLPLGNTLEVNGTEITGRSVTPRP